MQIAGKIAIVTGSARGIGKRIVEVLVEKGAKVVVVDILDQGAAVADELNASKGEKVACFQKCDVTNVDELKAMVDRALMEFGGLDILVNNAGIGGSLPWIEPDSEGLSRTLDINLRAPIEGTRLAIRYLMATRRTGCVVNVASIAAFHPVEFTPVYAATKSGLVSFTASCATLADSEPRIRVNAIAQSYVDTDIVHENVPPEVNQILRAQGEIPVDTVVGEVVRCIEDEKLAGDTIKVLPGMPGMVHDGPKARAFGFMETVKQEFAKAALLMQQSEQEQQQAGQQAQAVPAND
ncbi:hypothetical protein IWW55_000652 [Coemansia sp. RSA 2706]|nr:hypothetical protein LPJ70_002992 [Coemansia sp. RSA 2708]KAJ2308066.1 hypothetical protein IWW55_000652 [Coemansia sp. RSA 2706]KAJ2321995.1 hypothetical protein IWW52_000376 [Coemansia sp. RSA 2704]KAJ2739763.1 hypothetical protein H4R23_000234 [Coemansia sp. Cherry 401B]